MDIMLSDDSPWSLCISDSKSLSSPVLFSHSYGSTIVSIDCDYLLRLNHKIYDLLIWFIHRYHTFGDLLLFWVEFPAWCLEIAFAVCTVKGSVTFEIPVLCFWQIGSWHKRCFESSQKQCERTSKFQPCSNLFQHIESAKSAFTYRLPSLGWRVFFLSVREV